MVRIIKINNFLYKILLFFLVFAFPIHFFNISSAKIIIFTVLFIFYLNFKNNYQFKILADINFTKRILIFLMFYSFIILYFLFITLITKQFDFSLIYKLISSFIFIIFNFIFFNIFKNKDNPKTIIFIFLIQSFFILLCIISQNFYEVTSIFRDPLTPHLILSYGRMRGNAISGYQFFGIGTMYSFVIIYLFISEYFNKDFKNLIISIFIIIIGFVSSRFSAFGTLIGFLFWFLFKPNFKNKMKIIIYLLISSLIFIFLLIFIYKNIKNDKLIRVINYQIIYQTEMMIKGKYENVSSLNRLKEMYNVKFDNLFLGEGRYMNKDGTYYKRVDSGYLRIILYSGILGLILLLLSNYFFLFYLFPNGNKLLKISFFILFIVLNFKGDVFVYNNNILPILFALLTNNHKSTT